MKIDTGAISKLFSGAIIGIRGNRISVLLRADEVWYLDLTQGQLVLLTEFDTLIRPGDKCEGYRRRRDTHGDPRFLPCVYLGYSGRKDYPFVVKHEHQDVFSHIRLLPAEKTETELSSADLMEVIEDYRRLTRELDVAINGAMGAAKQASLCDIVCQVKREGIKRGIAICLLPKEHLANRCTCVDYSHGCEGIPAHVFDPSCPVHGENSPLIDSIADALKPPETVITYTIECPECRSLGYVTTIDGLAQRTFCNNCGHQLGLFSLKTGDGR